MSASGRISNADAALDSILAAYEKMRRERDEYRDLWEGGRQNTNDFEARAKAAERERDVLREALETARAAHNRTIAEKKELELRAVNRYLIRKWFTRSQRMRLWLKKLVRSGF